MPSGKTIKIQPFLSGKSPQNWLLPIPDLHRYPACATSFGLGWYSDGCFHLKNRLPKAINCHMYHHWNMLLNLLKPKSIVGSGWYGPPQHFTFHHWVYKYLLVIPPQKIYPTIHQSSKPNSSLLFPFHLKIPDGKLDVMYICISHSWSYKALFCTQVFPKTVIYVIHVGIAALCVFICICWTYYLKIVCSWIWVVVNIMCKVTI